MGYGGPRVAFYTANQYNNFAVAIDHENAARVRSILHRRNWPAEQEAQRQREEAFRSYERAQADEAARERAEEAEALERHRIKDERTQRSLANKTRRRSLTAAEVTARRARHARLCRLAEPRKFPEAMYGIGMIGGTVPHQSGRDGKLPAMGRNGAVYCAGVDRDRIVPARPALDGTVPPWMGSYSTHHGSDQLQAQMAKEAAAYYCTHPAPQLSASEQEMRQKRLQSIAAEHSMVPQPEGSDLGASEASDENRGFSGADEVQQHGMGSDYVDDEVRSIFSHGSSNGPIEATGNMHISTCSTKPSVQLHLSRYGGAMTAPRPARPFKATLESLTLPELADRLVQMQIPKPVAR